MNLTLDLILHDGTHSTARKIEITEFQIDLNMRKIRLALVEMEQGLAQAKSCEHDAGVSQMGSLHGKLPGEE